jgi:hypothetical protein
MTQLMLLLLTSCLRAPPRPHRRSSGRVRDERGDVPGWVLITVMTAGLVAALWAIAGPQLSQMLRDALGSVRG